MFPSKLKSDYPYWLFSLSYGYVDGTWKCKHYFKKISYAEISHI